MIGEQYRLCVTKTLRAFDAAKKSGWESGKMTALSQAITDEQSALAAFEATMSGRSGPYGEVPRKRSTVKLSHKARQIVDNAQQEIEL